MKKVLWIFLLALYFGACGDSTTSDGISEFESNTETLVLDTVIVPVDTFYLNGAESGCITQELKNKSGIKIICNGDSVGEVLYG